jgi:hypothetical protein
LVQINMFWRGISNTDRMRFLRSYLNENSHLESRRGEWAQKVITKTNRRLHRKFLFENGVPTRKQLRRKTGRPLDTRT